MSDTIITASIRAAAELDPRLLTDPAAVPLVAAGATLIAEVTDRFGTPSAPRWASGLVEKNVPRTYHCGGLDGHTSTGKQGAGVPRGALLIAQAMNILTRREVIDTELRGITFLAAAAHDHTQGCGRALLAEGQGPGLGDERLSGQTAAVRALSATRDSDAADLAELAVMATAFDPGTGAQNVIYDGHTPREVLAQEITAAADLLSLNMRRGPLSALEMVTESLFLHAKGQIGQARLDWSSHAITSTALMLDHIGDDDELRAAFAEGVAGQIAFFSAHRFTDAAIRDTCGAGIDQMFPGRTDNIGALETYAGMLRDGHTPRQIWETAREQAGY